MLPYHAEMWLRAGILFSISLAFVWIANAPTQSKPTFPYSTVEERLRSMDDANARNQMWSAWALRHHEYTAERSSEPPPFMTIPPLVDAAPIRARLLRIIGGMPHLEPSDDELIHIPEWCVAAVASAKGISTAEALALFQSALLVSATEDGLGVLNAIENAGTPSEADRDAQRTCAVELFYALPGDDPERETYAGGDQ